MCDMYSIKRKSTRCKGTRCSARAERRIVGVGSESVCVSTSTLESFVVNLQKAIDPKLNDTTLFFLSFFFAFFLLFFSALL